MKKSILILTLALVIVLIFLIKNNFNKSGTCILLTTTVYINTTDYMNEYNSPESRLKLYLDTINDWLKYTKLTIYVVESSNYNFPEYKNNPRVKIFTFKSNNNINCKDCSATPYEAESILKAFYYFNLKTYESIIKVTGKYFIPGIENLIKNIPNDADIFFQNSNENALKKQNSEIFGCKTKYLPTIMNLIISNSKYNMNFESTLYSLSQNNYKNYKIYTFPVIILNNPVKRSGDNKIIYAL
jgi:hypothetical protein